MKKLIINNAICLGDFMGPEMEEGTFHHCELNGDEYYPMATPKCPCPPVELNEAETPDDSKVENEAVVTQKNE